MRGKGRARKKENKKQLLTLIFSPKGRGKHKLR